MISDNFSQSALASWYGPLHWSTFCSLLFFDAARAAGRPCAATVASKRSSSSKTSSCLSCASFFKHLEHCPKRYVFLPQAQRPSCAQTSLPLSAMISAHGPASHDSNNWASVSSKKIFISSCRLPVFDSTPHRRGPALGYSWWNISGSALCINSNPTLTLASRGVKSQTACSLLHPCAMRTASSRWMFLTCSASSSAAGLATPAAMIAPCPSPITRFGTNRPTCLASATIAVMPSFLVSSTSFCAAMPDLPLSNWPCQSASSSSKGPATRWTITVLDTRILFKSASISALLFSTSWNVPASGTYSATHPKDTPAEAATAAQSAALVAGRPEAATAFEPLAPMRSSFSGIASELIVQG